MRENSDGSEIRNIAFSNFGTAIGIESSNNHIYGCRIGTGWIDQTDLGNNTGITISGGNNNLIGGSSAGERNIISGNGCGIRLDMMDTTTGNRIINNYIGVNSTGTAAMANSTGISAWGQNVIIGGNRLANEGNLICGGGIVVGGSGNTICGNVLGLNADQTAVLSNHTEISVQDGPNYIGLPQPGYENIIAGSQYGIRIDFNSAIVQNNWMGFNASEVYFPCIRGINICSEDGHSTIGGTGAYERNYICSSQCGIIIEGLGNNNTIIGNWINVFPSGNIPPTVGESGMDIRSSNTVIEKNIIIADYYVVSVEGNSNTIVGNWIGVLPSGDIPAVIGNSGIRFREAPDEGPSNNFIGIKATGEGNLIANVQNGIVFEGTGTHGNGVYGNTICAFTSAGILQEAGAPMSAMPVIDDYASNTLITGTADSESYIEVFRAEPRVSYAGGSLAFMGSTTTDDSGNWSLVPQQQFMVGDYACALATDAAGNNTSLFSVNKPVFVPTPTASPTITMTQTITPTTPTLTITSTISFIPRLYFKILYNQINPIHGEEALIRWSQPHTGPVTITIYTLLGSKIITLKNNQTYSKGQYHEVKWDGKTREGKIVGSGIYIVFFQTNGHTDRGKIAVVK